jgi:tetratricopeptide (TPR) repeat protein
LQSKKEKEKFMDGLRQKGIEAYKAGKRDEARKIFITAVKQSPDNESTWECLYGVASNDQERLQCLKQILRINPKNEKANQLLNQLTKEQPKVQSTSVANSNQTSIDNQQKLADIKQNIPPVNNASQERRTWAERFEEMLYKASLTALNRCFTLFFTFGIALGITPVSLGLFFGISGIATKGISSLMLIYYIPVIFMLSSGAFAK